MSFTSVYKAPGDVLTLTAPYDRDAGQGAKIGAIFGVARDDVDSGDDAAFMVVGVFDLNKQAADDWTQGDRIFWDDSNKRCDNDPTVGMMIGYATETTAASATSGKVKLLGCPDMLEGKQAAIADLTAITGGESPTEAEHNAIVTKVNALLAALRILGLITP